MSVKKSLWISLALAVTGLLFLGCPTEASSTEEEIPYEQTALWAAVVEAEADLNSTQISDDGSDVAPSAQWVTEAQAGVFIRAIGEASQIAKSGRAAAPTAEEAKPLADLAAAQKTFDGQKAIGTGIEVTVFEHIATGLTAGNIVIITGNVVANDTLEVAANKTLIIAAGAKLTTADSEEFSVVDTGKLIIKKGGTLEIVAGTSVGNSEAFTGTIIVEEGGTFINRDAADLLLKDGSDDTGAYEIYAGGVVIEEGIVFVGPSTGTNRGQIFQLNTGILTVTVTDDPARAYELKGDATLVDTLDITGGLALLNYSTDAKSTLTVAAGVDLFGDEYDPDDSLLTGDPGATIKLTGAGSHLTLLNDTEWGSVASDDDRDEAADEILITGVTWLFGGGNSYKSYLSGHASVSGFRTTGPAVLKLTTVSSDEVWIKQK